METKCGAYIYMYTHTHIHTYIHIYIYTLEYYRALKRKAILTYATTRMNLEAIMVKKQTSHKNINAYMSETNEVKFTETESRMVLARDWGRGNGSCLINTKFQFCNMGRALESGCTTTWIYLLLNCTRKDG